jgi:hypothetical protein
MKVSVPPVERNARDGRTMKASTIALTAERNGATKYMKTPPKALEQIADVVLNYRPKSRQPKPRKRKKAKRGK